jgi:hypothetical protein
MNDAPCCCALRHLVLMAVCGWLMVPAQASPSQREPSERVRREADNPMRVSCTCQAPRTRACQIVDQAHNHHRHHGTIQGGRTPTELPSRRASSGCAARRTPCGDCGFVTRWECRHDRPSSPARTCRPAKAA